MAKEYYLWIDGKKIVVTEKVYRIYKQPIWRAAKKRKIRSKMELSYESLVEDGYCVPDKQEIDVIVEGKLLIGMLFAAFKELTYEEQYLIDELFNKGKSERVIADEMGRSTTAVHKQKERILKKLREELNNW